MTKKLTLKSIFPIILLVVLISSCAPTSEPVELPATLSPLTITNNLSLVDLCSAIPIEDIEAIMGRKLANPPEFFFVLRYTWYEWLLL